MSEQWNEQISRADYVAGLERELAAADKFGLSKEIRAGILSELERVRPSKAVAPKKKETR